MAGSTKKSPKTKAALQKENAQLRRENERLKMACDKAERAGKRQAAPFSKNSPERNPKKPGRKAGPGYGTKGHRKRPETVDEILDASLPEECSKCGDGNFVIDRVAEQYQTEIPEPKPHVRQFNIPVGHCCNCKGRVQGRHPLQTSNALGAASSQLGARAVAMATLLQKELGLSYGKAEKLFKVAFGITVTRGGLVQAIQRMARRLIPTHEAIVKQLPKEKMVVPDETGWRVNGLPAWLWVFVGVTTVVYKVATGRGFAEATKILPASYKGLLVRDGWKVYLSYAGAKHQTCLNHLLARCSKLLNVAKGGAARVPHLVRNVLKDALALRDRRDELDPHGFQVLRGKIVARMDRLLEWRPSEDENRKLLQHLRTEHEIGAIFRFLESPGLCATNHLAEQGVRPAVVNRKVWGGNRTWKGAETQGIIMSVMGTARMQGLDSLALMEEAQRSPGPLILPLVSSG